MRAAAIVLVLTATAAMAAADGTSFQGAVMTAETAERSAVESKDPAAFEVCGQAYLEVVNRARVEMPDAAPPMLYNAGVCFEHAGSVGAAITVYKQLESEFRTSPLVPKAIARRAQLYLAMAWYAEAATELETYATKYAGERDASDALENAMRLRAALGDDGAAEKNAQRWIRMFGAKQPRVAAEAGLWLARQTRERGEPEDAVRAYQQWIKVHGGRAERHLLALAYTAIGELQWDASCKVKGTAKGGLCLATAKKTAMPRCGQPPPVPAARDARLAAEATKALQQAARAADASHDGYGLLLADHARLLLVDAKLEQALAIEMPSLVTDATGISSPASAKALTAWLQTWMKELGEAQRGYEQLLRSKNLRVSVLAAGRLAWLAQHAADTLASAPLPALKKPKLDEIRAAYCDALAEHAAPLAARADEAAAACLDVAARTGVVDETASCVAVFDRRHPAAAGAGERLPAVATPRVRDVEPPIRYRPPGTAAPVTPSPR